MILRMLINGCMILMTFRLRIIVLLDMLYLYSELYTLVKKKIVLSFFASFYDDEL